MACDPLIADGFVFPGAGRQPRRRCRASATASGATPISRGAAAAARRGDAELAAWTHREPDDPGIALLEGAAILGDILTLLPGALRQRGLPAHRRVARERRRPGPAHRLSARARPRRPGRPSPSSVRGDEAGGRVRGLPAHRARSQAARRAGRFRDGVRTDAPVSVARPLQPVTHQRVAPRSSPRHAELRHSPQAAPAPASAVEFKTGRPRCWCRDPGATAARRAHASANAGGHRRQGTRSSTA